MRLINTVLIWILLTTQVSSAEYLYIFNEKCITELYGEAKETINDGDISIIKHSQGITLRFELKNPIEEYKKISSETYKKILLTEYFLSKIKNLAIIEVHTEGLKDFRNLSPKNWEISTVIANNIEAVIIGGRYGLNHSRIHSVGYGEFMPSKNTPNKGSHCPNHVDIIILCNINGE